MKPWGQCWRGARATGVIEERAGEVGLSAYASSFVRGMS